MFESTPHLAPIVILMLLGAVLLCALGAILLVVAALFRSKRLAKAAGVGTLIVVSCYFLMLFAASLTSREKVLPPGGQKYFCEIDCHIAYSVAGVQIVPAVGPESHQSVANGQFVIVGLKVWFDPSTISPRRGDGPLTPNARRVVLVDDSGSVYRNSPVAEASLQSSIGQEMTLRQALRPGESYLRHLVFDVPKRASGLRLLITEDDPETHVIIGHENSLLHAKIFLGLSPAPTLSSVNKSL
ncbi:MAG TPA: hypothetical protein VJN93_00890 [Candidatus Acidoferrum sp.]|nr:hypothetical protein [Candidatus Acidoferrum sp.]